MGTLLGRALYIDLKSLRRADPLRAPLHAHWKKLGFGPHGNTNSSLNLEKALI